MRKLWLAWILVLISAIGCAQFAGTFGSKQSLNPSFEFACDAIEGRFDWVSCKDLAAPIIVTSKVVDGRYLGFYYHGERYIFIRWDLDPVRARDVIVHETVHYIIDHLGILMSHCHSEAMAREITSEYSGKPEDPTWKKRYGCDLWSTGSVQW